MTLPTYSIYMVTSTVNGKSYIGLTSRTIPERWKSHLSSARNGSVFRFHSAIRKYGEEAWLVKCLHNGLSESEARLMEEKLIELFDTQNKAKGYNAKPGGCGGWIVPAEKWQAWAEKKAANSRGLLNPNSSKLTDEDIAELFWSVYQADPEEFSIRKAKRLLHASHGVPLHLKSDFRFVRYGGGDAGLRNYLKEVYGLNPEVFRRKSLSHRKSLSDSISGKKWFHHPETGKNKQLLEAEGERLGWTRGRFNAED